MNKIICIHEYDNHEVRFLVCPKDIEDSSERIEYYMIQDLMNNTTTH